MLQIKTYIGLFLLLSAIVISYNHVVAKDSANTLESSPALVHSTSDVVIVGTGISGLSAAIEVANSGRSVILLDMGLVFGGHAVVAAGAINIPVSPMQKSKGIEDSYELAINDFINWGEDTNKPWVEYYVKHASHDIYDWVTELGVEFFTIAQPPGNSVPRVHVPKGFGLELVSKIYREALSKKNIQFVWNSQVDDLLQKDNRIIGAAVTNTRSGKKYSYYGQAVIIATGGFQSNLERVLENWPSEMIKPKHLLAGSGAHSRGSGLDLASSVGGQLHRMNYQWNYISGIPNPGFKGGNRGLSFFPVPGKSRLDIWLNDKGERFANECDSPKYNLPKVLAQPNQHYWSVFDSKNKPRMTISGPGWTPERLQTEIYDNPAITQVADSLDDLSQKMGLSASILKQSVTRFNAMVVDGMDSDFTRFGNPSEQVSGYCGASEVLDTPPYYAVRLFPLARKSMGGIEIDLSARVLDKNGHPIPGLYAVGEVTGFAGINGKAGLEGTFLGPCIVTGRVAGRAINHEITKTGKIDRTAPGRFTIHPIIEGETECLGCHKLDEQLSQYLHGYDHFGYVHKLVQKQQMPCLTCHASMYPYDSLQHDWDPVLKINSCSVCHGGGD